MKHCLYIAVILLLAASSADAANTAFANSINAQVGQAMNVQWPSTSISTSQLQGLFSQYPGASQLNIQFPNNTNWGVTPSSLQNIVSSYTQQGQSLGLSASGLPNLSFSSLRNMRVDPDMLSIPIANLSDGASNALDNGLRELRFQQLHLSESLPDWLKDGIVTFWGWLVEAWNWLAPRLAALFQ